MLFVDLLSERKNSICFLFLRTVIFKLLEISSIFTALSHQLTHVKLHISNISHFRTKHITASSNSITELKTPEILLHLAQDLHKTLHSLG